MIHTKGSGTIAGRNDSELAAKAPEFVDTRGSANSGSVVRRAGETSARLALRATTALSPRAAGALAYVLFRRPFGRSRVRPAERSAHLFAVTDTLDVGGRQVVTYRWGDGAEPVLLLHGWQSRASRFAPFVEELRARGLTPIGFDAPGNGDSGGIGPTVLDYAEIARQLQERHGEFRAMLAHSFGVLGAFQALRSGVRADRVVAIGGVCDMEYLLHRFSARLRLDARVVALVRERADERLLAPESDIWERFSASYGPERVRVPILVVHDEDDPMATVDQGYRLAAAYSDRARLFVTRGLGHHRVMSDPAVVAEVLRFLDEDHGYRSRTRDGVAVFSSSTTCR
ncbi:alpha/beta hydrolase [Embleya sp. NPDC059237]|uniref:alpha/beta hydrolase n=1 Tax=Embleya sp. NPDC059237 TaxID=3346784 RepID=UPI0036B43854